MYSIYALRFPKNSLHVLTYRAVQMEISCACPLAPSNIPPRLAKSHGLEKTTACDPICFRGLDNSFHGTDQVRNVQSMRGKKERVRGERRGPPPTPHTQQQNLTAKYYPLVHKSSSQRSTLESTDQTTHNPQGKILTVQPTGAVRSSVSDIKTHERCPRPTDLFLRHEGCKSNDLWTCPKSHDGGETQCP